MISDNLKNRVKSITGLSDASIIRIWGQDRYETSLNIAKYFNLKGDYATIATGENFPDALAGSVLSAKYNAPIILVNQDITNQKKYIKNIGYNNIIIFGGEGAVNAKIQEALSK